MILRKYEVVLYDIDSDENWPEKRFFTWKRANRHQESGNVLIESYGDRYNGMYYFVKDRKWFAYHR